MLRLSACVVVTAAAGACGSAKETPETPGLVPRGTTMTTVKPTRQDIVNRVSLSGKVTLNPVFGLVATAAGEVRYLNVPAVQGTPTKPTRVATIYAGSARHHVEVPAGSTFSGRLVDDRSKVLAGMPIVSAKYAGYGIVADIDGAQAYKIADALSSVQAQISGGPGPFACSVLGSIAALPAGTIPAPPEPVTPDPLAPPVGQQQPPGGSEATGLRLVCTPPAGVKMINGAAATLEVVTQKAVNALVLPVEAVSGAQGSGKVDVVKPDRTRETRDVELGLTDGRYIEIKSGLTGDETIAVPGPNLPAPKLEPDRGFPKPMEPR